MSYAYIPGTCNLGKDEIRRRQLTALIGLGLSLGALIAMVLGDAPRGARWSLFGTWLIFAIGFIQSRKKFCLAYGFLGTFNLGKLGDISRVQSADDRSADRKTALTILVQGLLLALALTVLSVYSPI